MKKFIALMFVALFTAVSFADTETVNGVTYTYSISNGEATIGTGGGSAAIPTWTDGDLVIPSTLGGCPVTTIGDYAFWECYSLESVTIPSSVTTIGSYAFYNCIVLTSVTIPEGVTAIGERAFYGTPFYTNLPDGLVVLGKGYLYTYKGTCPSLVMIPYGVTTIGDYAFSGCYSLTSVTIPSSVTTIGENAFRGCRSLTSVTIPEGVTTIRNHAFYECWSLKEVHITDLAKWCAISFADYDANPCSCSQHLYLKDEDIVDLVIPDDVTTIGDYVFFGCSSLASVTIPDSVTTILGRAFGFCSSLTSVTIPDSVTTIGDYAFEGCRSLTSVTIPEGVTTIRNHAFYDCSSLKEVHITDLAKWCAISFADDCANPCYYSHHLYLKDEDIVDLVIPDGVTTIGENAFRGCRSLTSVTIPEGVTTIGESAFYECWSLMSVTIPDSVETISSYAFYGCSSLTSVTIPDSVTTIGYYAFGFCSSLTSVTIPDSVTTIRRGAFWYCISLTSVTIPSSVTTIGEWAFGNCTLLTSVTIPEGVTTIGENAFYSCTSLTTAYVEKGDTARVKEMMRGAGANVDALTFVELELPKADGGPYTETVNGVTYTYFISNGETKITRAPRSTSGALVIPSTLGGCLVTTIGDEAFLECSSLTSVTIPEGVTTIGEWAFGNCTLLTSVTIPEGVTTIGENAFRGCKNLSDIYIMNPNMEPPLTSPFVGCNWDLSIHVPATWHGRNDMLYGYHIEREGSRELVNTVVVTNVVVHYVVNSVQPEFAKPVSEDTGFVNVIAEVKGTSVAVPQTWAENYPEFAAKFGSDFTKALTMKSGKVAMGGREMLVWEDYVAGTDPTDEKDKFTASMTMVDGKPVISWTPQLDDERAALRKYTTYGKAKLTDSEWTVVPAGQEEAYNFFKVTVEMK